MKTFDDLKSELLEDPEVKLEYEAMEQEFSLAREVIRARVAAGITQKELAARGLELNKHAPK